MFFRTWLKITWGYVLFHELGIKAAKKFFAAPFIPIGGLDRYSQKKGLENDNVRKRCAEEIPLVRPEPVDGCLCPVFNCGHSGGADRLCQGAGVGRSGRRTSRTGIGGSDAGRHFAGVCARPEFRSFMD